MSSINRKSQDDSKIGIGIVEGGHQDDPDPQKAGRIRVRDPMRQGNLVKTEHLPFIQQVSNPQGFGQHEFTRPPRPGQLVQYTKNLDGYKQILGILHGVETPSGSLPGGQNLDQLIPQLKTASQTLTGMRIAPIIKQITESNRTGLQQMTKELEEKSEMDRHELYSGLPTHGAIASMAGLVSQPLKQISTALTSQATGLTSSMLSGLGGSSFSIGSILESLSEDLLNEVFENMAPEVATALNNMQTLMSSEQFGSLPGNFTTGGQVNSETFLPKVVEQLKNAKNVSDLDDALLGIVNDSFADDALDGVEELIEDITGLFGPGQKKVSANGHVSQSNDSLTDQAQSAFSSLVSSIPSASDTLFGSDSKITEIMQRLKDQGTVSASKTNLENKSPDKKMIRQLLYQGLTVTRGHSVLG